MSERMIDQLMQLAGSLYLPLYRVAPQLPVLKALLIMSGLTLWAVALGCTGYVRYLLVLGGAYALGALWMLPFMRTTGFYY